MRHFDLRGVLGLNIGLMSVVEAVLRAVSYLESNYLFAMSHWRKYGIHKGLFLWPSLWLILAWSIFLLEEGAGIPLRKFGIVPGDVHSWYGPITFPWLHSDVNHIVSNTISLFFVGALIRYSFPKIFDRVWFISLMAPGSCFGSLVGQMSIWGQRVVIWDGDVCILQRGTTTTR